MGATGSVVSLVGGNVALEVDGAGFSGGVADVSGGTYGGLALTVSCG